jgi:hypothetical protein
MDDMMQSQRTCGTKSSPSSVAFSGGGSTASCDPATTLSMNVRNGFTALYKHLRNHASCVGHTHQLPLHLP